MKKLLSLVLASGVVFASAFVPGAAEAQGATRCGRRTPGVNARQGRQQRRIYGGVASGELTRRETLRLGREQYQIALIERRVKRDGDVTARERARLHRELNEASRHIYRAKHNERDRN
ncbi:MAG TPA: hypothetical protein VFX96_07240 [Pyrinomonadaceae bacterium]|nr:hypothetical protein [Pyrinomonadaceae bacterium]